MPHSVHRRHGPALAIFRPKFAICFSVFNRYTSSRSKCLVHRLDTLHEQHLVRRPRCVNAPREGKVRLRACLQFLALANEKMGIVKIKRRCIPRLPNHPSVCYNTHEAADLICDHDIPMHDSAVGEKRPCNCRPPRTPPSLRKAKETPPPTGFPLNENRHHNVSHPPGLISASSLLEMTVGIKCCNHTSLINLSYRL